MPAVGWAVHLEFSERMSPGFESISSAILSLDAVKRYLQVTLVRGSSKCLL
jgi:hypothetical protein